MGESQDTRGVSLAQWSLKDLCWEQGDTELQCTRIYRTHHDCWQAGELHRFPAMIPRNPYSDSLGVEKSNLSISPRPSEYLEAIYLGWYPTENRVPVTMSSLPPRKVTHSSIWHLSDILRYSSPGKQRHF